MDEVDKISEKEFAKLEDSLNKPPPTGEARK